MIKRLIFDLDNTLIIWKDEYVNALIKVIKKHNLNIDYNPINDIIENYEKNHDTLTKQSLLDEINIKCNLNLSLDFIEDLIEEQKYLSEYREDIVNIFDDLSKKYEIVLLTNWYLDTQSKRLEILGILKYFKELYGPEKNKLKPSIEAFNMACSNYKYNECVMIGDNVDIDIKVPKKLGINTILVDYRNKYNDIEYIKINNLKELGSVINGIK